MFAEELAGAAGIGSAFGGAGLSRRTEEFLSFAGLFVGDCGDEMVAQVVYSMVSGGGRLADVLPRK